LAEAGPGLGTVTLVRARVDGAALRAARVARGLTQMDLARAVGVAGPERISAWEHGTNGPHVSQIPVLARVLEVGQDSLLASDEASNRLRDLRWAGGLTVRQVADMLHVGRNTYLRWETGERPFPDRARVFRQLADVLGTSEEAVRAAVTGIGSDTLAPLADPRSHHKVEELNGGGDLTGGVDGLPGLADKLNHLFATVPRSTTSTRPHSNESAAEALQQYRIRVTKTHLSHLRAGRRDNPSARLLSGIAQLLLMVLIGSRPARRPCRHGRRVRPWWLAFRGRPSRRCPGSGSRSRRPGSAGQHLQPHPGQIHPQVGKSTSALLP